MKRSLVYPILISSAVVIGTLFLPPNAYDGRWGMTGRSSTKQYQDTPKDKRKTAKDIAGKILGPGSRIAIEIIDKASGGSEGSQERYNRAQERIRERDKR